MLAIKFKQEADDILEPLKGAFQLMETAINMRGNYTNYLPFGAKI